MKRPCLEFASLNLYNLHGVTVFFCLQRWRRRWFTLQQGKLPDEFLLNYYSDETKRKLKGTISLNDVEQVLRFTHFKRIHIWNWSCCLLFNVHNSPIYDECHENGLVETIPTIHNNVRPTTYMLVSSRQGSKKPKLW